MGTGLCGKKVTLPPLPSFSPCGPCSPSPPFQGGSAFLGGCFPRILPNKPDGTLDLASIEALAARGEDIHCQRLKLVCLEQTHNMLGGLPLPLEFTDAVGALASRRGLAVHVDGARLLNAAAALGAPPARLVAAASSACLCLSKGLGAPVGSVLVGPSGFVAKARRLRKALGGGMRQAGVLAAAGLVALDEVAPLLAADHGRCGALASRLAALPGVSLRDGPPPTNIVFLRLHPALDAAALAAGLRAAGVLASVAPGACRLVLHHQVTDAGVERVVAAFAGLVGPMMEAAAAAAAEAPGEGGA